MVSESATPLRRGFASRSRTKRIVDAVRSADPAGERLLTSLRCMAGAVLAAGGGYELVREFDSSVRFLTLPIGLAIFTSLTLPEHSRRAHLGRCAVSTVGSASVAALLTGPVELAVFIVVIIGCAWLGRWPDVGRQLGFLTFLAFYFTILIRPAPADAPIIAGLAAVAAAASVIAIFVVVRDHPETLPARLRNTYLAHLERLVDSVIVYVGAGSGHGRQRRMRQSLVLVQETALKLVSALDDARSAAAVGDVAQLRGEVLAAESLAEHLVWAAITSAPTESERESEQRRVARARRLAHVRDNVRPVEEDTAPLVPDLSGVDHRSDEVLIRLIAAIARLDNLDLDERPANLPPLAPRPASVPNPIWRQVLQALIACTAAMLIGRMISIHSWPWATIGAYAVVTTTSSRGSGVRKAADRIVGTGLGAVVGVGAAAVLGGLGAWLWAGVAGLLFVATWVMRLNYRITMMLLTLNIALLAELRGQQGTEVLLTRVGETAIGAAVGAAVVFFVVPTHTRQLIDDAVTDLLVAIDTAVEFVSKHQQVDHDAVRQASDAVSKLRATTDDLRTSTLSPIAAEVRAARLLATAARVRVSALVNAQIVDGTDAVTDDCITALRQHLDNLRAHIDNCESAPHKPTDFPTAHTTTDVVLQAIDDRIAGYANVRGLTLRPQPGSLVIGTISRRD